MTHEVDIFQRIVAALGSGRAAVYVGEMQLAGWQDTHAGGAKVVLWLPDAENLAPFRDLTARKGKTAGHRLLTVMVEVNDDESVGGPTAVQKAAGQFTGLGPAGMWLVTRCRELEFRKWLAGWYAAAWNRTWKTLDAIPVTERPESTARAVVKEVLGVESRKDVDGNEKAMATFNNMRAAYAKHLESLGG